jgi:hypothetical protein
VDDFIRVAMMESLSNLLKEHLNQFLIDIHTILDPIVKIPC